MKWISKINKKEEETLDKYIICADFETLLIDNEHYVFGIGYMHNKIINYMYIKEGIKNEKELKKESEKLLIDFLKILNNKYKKCYIYFHNLGSFDGVFILKTMVKYKEKDDIYECLIRNNRIYKIKYNKITFLDSMLLINESLDNISKNLLKKRKEEIDYNIFKDYKSCIENKNKIIKYMLKDVKLLYEIIITVKKRIFKLFNINITKNITIPSIGLNIYRKNYINDYEIINTKDYLYDYIKNSYHGGLTNIILPKIDEGYIYDINSLYPYVMKEKYMPTGQYKFIYKDFKDISEYFGFIECKIYIPKDIDIPPLTTKIEGTLIQPTGKIKGVFFSEEIKNALKYGCKIIDIYKVCNFEKKEIIFKEFIQDMYNNRLDSDNKTDNMLYKLIMNSLYGRLGMNNEYTKTEFVEEDDQWLYEVIYDVDSVIENKIITYKTNNVNLRLIKDNYKYMAFSKDKLKKIKNEINKIDKKVDVTMSAVHIASAVASYARIELINHMNEHLKNGGKIYYYDTDSIHTDISLKENLINSKEIGKFKLECKIKEGYYLSPKIYGIKTDKGDEILKFKGIPKKEIERLSFEWYRDQYMNNKTYEIEIEKPVLKRLKELKVIKIDSKYRTEFKTKKYKKIYNEEGLWIRNEWINFK